MLAGQFCGPTNNTYLYHSAEFGAERVSRPALSTVSQAEAIAPHGSSGAPIGRQIERPKRTKQTPFAMWVGNIDSAITVQELYQFFRQIDPAELQSPDESNVVSIFLIPKSNCAFVNFRTEAALTESITRFHGARLRPNHSAPRLACRRRTPDNGDLDGEWDEGDEEKGAQG
jgi:RNA recognition motif-containing protein